jgi:hypothetical protein
LQADQPAREQLLGDRQARADPDPAALVVPQRRQTGVDLLRDLQQPIRPLHHDNPGRRQLGTTGRPGGQPHTGLRFHRGQPGQDDSARSNSRR